MADAEASTEASATVSDGGSARDVYDADRFSVARPVSGDFSVLVDADTKSVSSRGNETPVTDVGEGSGAAAHEEEGDAGDGDRKNDEPAFASSASASASGEWEHADSELRHRGGSFVSPLRRSSIASVDSVKAHGGQVTLGRKSHWRKLRTVLIVVTRLNAIVEEIKTFGASTNRSRLDDDDWQRILEVDRVEPKKYIILPASWQLRLWNTLMVVMYLYMAIAIPYRLGFQSERTTGWLVFDMLLFLILTTDIVVNFRTAYIDDDGHIVVDPGRIAKRYLKGWFAFDLLATVPYELFLDDLTGGNISINQLARLSRLPRAMRLLRVLRVFRLVKIGHLHRYVRRFAQYLNMSPSVARLLSMALWVTMSTHWVACMWHFLAITSDDPDTWLHRVDVAHLDDNVRYSFSVYWALTTLTTVGFGDITARTSAEVPFAMFCMVMGVVWTGLVVSSMTSILSRVDKKSVEIAREHSAVVEFMRETRLPLELCAKIHRHFANTHKRGAGVDTAFVLDRLPANLRREVIIHTNSGVIRRIPFLKNRSQQLQAAILSKLHPLFAEPGEFICHEDTPALHMYFLMHGRVKISRGGVSMRVYVNGTYFGEIGIFCYDERVLSVQAITSCEVLSLEKSQLRKLCEDFPSIRMELTRTALERLDRLCSRFPGRLPPPHYGFSVGEAGEESTEARHPLHGQWPGSSHSLAASMGSAGGLSPKPPMKPHLGKTFSFEPDSSLTAMPGGRTRYTVHSSASQSPRKRRGSYDATPDEDTRMRDLMRKQTRMESQLASILQLLRARDGSLAAATPPRPPIPSQ